MCNVHLVALLFCNHVIFLFSRLNLYKWDVTCSTVNSFNKLTCNFYY